MPTLSMFYGLIVYMYAKDKKSMMNPRVVNVKPEKNYTLHVWFKNGEEGVFDVKLYLGYEMFKPLKDLSFFNSVRPAHGTIQWANEADFCPDTVYLKSVKIRV